MSEPLNVWSIQTLLCIKKIWGHSNIFNSSTRHLWTDLLMWKVSFFEILPKNITMRYLCKEMKDLFLSPFKIISNQLYWTSSLFTEMIQLNSVSLLSAFLRNLNLFFTLDFSIQPYTLKQVTGLLTQYSIWIVSNVNSLKRI